MKLNGLGNGQKMGWHLYCTAPPTSTKRKPREQENKQWGINALSLSWLHTKTWSLVPGRDGCGEAGRRAPPLNHIVLYCTQYSTVQYRTDLLASSTGGNNGRLHTYLCELHDFFRNSWLSGHEVERTVLCTLHRTDHIPGTTTVSSRSRITRNMKKGTRQV